MKKHIFLTGDKGVGKSTLVRRLLAEGSWRLGGFFTVKHEDKVYLLRPGESPCPDNLLFRCGQDADPARFDTLGCAALSVPCDVILMDELGPHESGAQAFQAAVFRALDGGTPVLGVLQKADTPFLRQVAAHPQVQAVEVTPENREELAKTLHLSRPDTVRSCGAIVIAEDRVLLVRSRKGWSFPKGHMEPGETPIETARREVFEETGIEAEIDPEFSRTVPSILPGDRRTVTFFLGRSPKGCRTPVPHEVPDARWFLLTEAAEQIPFPADRAAFLDAAVYWQQNN